MGELCDEETYAHTHTHTCTPQRAEKTELKRSVTLKISNNKEQKDTHEELSDEMLPNLF